eukprot:scaffold86119_cov43-Cyclotella_meneghiniana.AAC.3
MTIVHCWGMVIGLATLRMDVMLWPYFSTKLNRCPALSMLLEFKQFTISNCKTAAAIYPLELGWYQTNHYETWYTTSQDTNETVDKLGM